MLRCVVSTKIQILKAIHNSSDEIFSVGSVVLYLRKYKFWKQFTTSLNLPFTVTVLCCIYENTNFESNSQRVNVMYRNTSSCVVSTKIQILKAIHNVYFCKSQGFLVVLYLRKYKFWKQFTTPDLDLTLYPELCCIYENTNFESNSQPLPALAPGWPSCVVSTKIQILKAIHNDGSVVITDKDVVLYLRKYKFWKQFTTPACGKK